MPELPGEKKVFFSSYYQGVSDVCFVHAVYDHIPERTGMDGYSEKSSQYWLRIANAPGH